MLDVDQDMPLWLAYIIVGAIDEHWWNGSWDKTWDLNDCGPCKALRDMPRSLQEAACRKYELHAGGRSYYWDTTRDTFHASVDFSKPADFDAILP